MLFVTLTKQKYLLTNQICNNFRKNLYNKVNTMYKNDFENYIISYIRIGLKLDSSININLIMDNIKQKIEESSINIKDTNQQSAEISSPLEFKSK